MNRYCPDCGTPTLRVIESTQPSHADGEYKDVCTCDRCEVIVYIVRREVSAVWEDGGAFAGDEAQGLADWPGVDE